MNKRGGWKLSKETKIRMSLASKGKKKSYEHRKNIAKSKLGILNPNYKDGLSDLRSLIYKSAKYDDWRSKIFKRDHYTCQDCSIKGGNGKTIYLEVHHIKSFNSILKEFLNINNKLNPLNNEDKLILRNLAMKYKLFWYLRNGVVLCVSCHKKTYNFGSKEYN